jgi:drug/metabolite transporter (DMT)-like permease
MLLLLSTCYGAGFFFIKISLDGFSNLSAGGLRIIVAALSLLFLMSLTRHRFSLPRESRVPVLLNGVLFIGFPFLSLPWILNFIPTSMVAIYYSTVPIFVLVLSRFLLGRQISASKWIGFLVGSVGISYLAFSQIGAAPASLDEGRPTWFILLPHAVSILSSVALAAGVVHMSTIRDFRPVQYQGYSLMAGCLVALPLFMFNAPTAFPGWIPIGGAVMAGLITTGAGQALRGLLVQREGATFTTRNGYLTPVVASVLGLSFLGESLTMTHGISYAAVAVGLFISAQR